MEVTAEPNTQLDVWSLKKIIEVKDIQPELTSE